MRIESARLHRVQIPFRGSFGHALSERSRSDAVFVELRDEQGGVGWGEILPRAYVTGETIEGVLSQTGPAAVESLLGVRLADRDAVVGWLCEALPRAGRALATFGGLELALLDLAGRRLGFSLAQVLGGEPGPALPAGVIIGFEVKTEALRRHCIGLRWKGHRHVKVKVGQPDDIERLRTISRVFGPEVPLRLDANMAWGGRASGHARGGEAGEGPGEGPDEGPGEGAGEGPAERPADEPRAALEQLDALGRLGIPLHSVEQPLPADDLAGMRWLRDHGSVPVMADESVCSLADARRIVAEQAADIFNVRVGKHGGVLASRAIVECARGAGLGVHLGTLVGESGVLSRVAEVFGRCVPGFACLDGKGQNRFLLEEDVLRPASADDSNPAIHAALDAPGLGVAVDPEAIGRLRVGEPVELRAPAP